MITKRPLSKKEQQFIKEGESGYFSVSLDDHGAPFALGEEATENLFSMEVESAPDGDRWIYYLPENADLAERLR